MTMPMPPLLHTVAGRPRRVGVELEMNGVSLDELAATVARVLSLTISQTGRYERRLGGDPAGHWQVELDFDLLKRLGREKRHRDTFAGELGDSAEEMLKWMAENLVPVELVSPPLPMHRLDDCEALVAELRAAGARGTSDRWLNAFGMHFNPEVPDERANTITAYLKAFVCLYDWLWQRAQVNVSRQMTNYIDPYPTDYVRLLVRADYWPGREQLIDDYLRHNPTRNRALDMMPLFIHMDEDRVRARTSDALIKPRPSFHYRLPDCEIHKPDWTLSQAWGDWVEVERLAADANRLAGCCQAYQGFLADPLDRWFGDWVDQLEARWLLR